MPGNEKKSLVGCGGRMAGPILVFLKLDQM